jgi:hypothetical protein
VGKLCKYDNRWSCFIGNGGTEQRYDDYKMLVGAVGSFNWTATTSASVPPTDSVWGGWLPDSGDCFVCRATLDGNQHVGKACKYDNRWSCFIGNGGIEQRYENYEVLRKP